MHPGGQKRWRSRVDEKLRGRKGKRGWSGAEPVGGIDRVGVGTEPVKACERGLAREERAASRVSVGFVVEGGEKGVVGG